MIVHVFRLRTVIVLALFSLVVAGMAPPATAQLSGSFLAVLNERNSGANTDNRRTVQFYDAHNLIGGPLFSVFIPFEPGTGTLYEEPNTVTVNPATGDIYILAFDNIVSPANTAWGVDDNGTPEDTSDDDTYGDWDLFRINFSVVLDHWTTNFMGQDVRTLPNPGGWGAEPVAKQNMTDMQDYVTYGVLTPYAEQAMNNGSHLSPNGAHDQTHSNTFILGDMTGPGGAIEKIGELNRNRYDGSSNFHQPLVTFIDEETLLMIDDARQPKNIDHDSANDYDYRIVERVSTSPGAATVSDPETFTGVDGGFNNTTTESWESRRIAQMLLDTDETTSMSFLSDPQSIAYYNTGSVRGAWVVDRDTSFTSGGYPVPDEDSGDDIAFLQLDANGDSLGYRQFVGGTTKFEMSNNPNDPQDMISGRVGKLFVDSDTGDLVIVEEGFTDSGNLMEPAVIRAQVNYDNDGMIEIVSWGPKHVLGADLMDGLPKDSEDTFRERGYFSAYDSVTDRVYFVTPGDSNTDPNVTFGSDVYVFDLTTNSTEAYLNVGNNYSLFFGGSNVDAADKIVAFTLAAACIMGDFNCNGAVENADLTLLLNNWGEAVPPVPAGWTGMPPTAPAIDNDELTKLLNNWGNVAGSASAGAGAVPEPASAVLVVLGLFGGGLVRRRK